ncbi:uncharacterized protein BXZ73DRAFT_55807 [Epithele typhae]|uniref:uncharacterized protein n=1 Tax=Epithele typhae TaxID=378194 RepID=UPI00200779A2|nr:uncharacterized protein BXZ73DRAFT_55807 [Epithele typhae]KAH9912851.1 hypothetical protein BXZ73DRAFT_55807 [Epithele typhae]
MEKALSIAEVVRHICAFSSNGTLANLACSSQTTHEPATQVLWRNLPNFVPLVLCLPQDALEIDRHGYCLRRVLTPADWTRFQKYASHVRHLGASKEDSSLSSHRKTVKIGENIISQLAASRPTFVLFPNLLRLTASTWLSPTLLAVVIMLVGPHLNHLRIVDWMEDDTRNLFASLHLISGRFPSLKRLTIKCFELNGKALGMALFLPPSHFKVHKTMDDASWLRGLQHLTHLRCRGLSLDAPGFRMLQELPNLRAVSICLPETLHLDDSLRRTNAFINLEEFGVVTTVAAYTAFSLAVTLPNVTKMSIEIVCHSQIADDALPALFSALRYQLSPTTLLELSVRPMERMPLEFRGEAITKLDPLRPLFEFHALTLLTFAFPAPFKLQEKDYVELLSLLPPHIEHFRFASAGSVPDGYYPSIRILEAFGAHASYLRTLAFPVNGTSIAVDQALQVFHADQPRCRVQWLDLDLELKVDDRKEEDLMTSVLALWIAQRCPDVSGKTFKIRTERRRSMGVKIGTYLDFYRHMREDERRMLARQAAN